jgi:hypothetical protein
VSHETATVRAGVAALLTIVWAAVLMFLPPKYPFPHKFDHDVDSPVLALEISRGIDDIDRILRPGPTPEAEANNCYLGTRARHPTPQICEAQAKDYEYESNELDLVFIPLYAFSLWSFARVFTNRTRLLTLLILCTGVFDYLEDWQIFRARQGEIAAIYIPSLVKWALLGLVLFGIAIVLLRSKILAYSIATKRILSIVYFLAGILLLISAAVGKWIGYSLIELGTGLFGFLLLVQAIGFLGPYLAVPAIKQTFVDNFCEERKKAGRESLIAVKAAPSGSGSAINPLNN